MLVSVAGDGAVSRQVHPVVENPWHDVVVRVSGARQAEEIREQVHAALLPLDGIVRVTVSGEVAPGADLSRLDLDGLGRHLDALVLRPLQLSTGDDLAALAAEPTVRGHFIRDVLASELSEREQQQVLQHGAARP